jgi:VanZ family protein
MGLWSLNVIAVIIGSLAPGEDVPDVLGSHDKWVHFTGYLLLGFLPAICLRKVRQGVLLGLAAIALGGLLEIGQNFAPGRSPEIADALANATGVAGGIALAFLLRRASSRR